MENNTLPKVRTVQAENMPLPVKARTFIVTGSVAAVTVAGTWYGADLKSSQEVKKVCSTSCCSTLFVTVMEAYRWDGTGV